MLHLDLKIVRKSQAEPAWPELEDAEQGKCTKVAILEKGTVEGKAAIAFNVESEGKNIIFMLTENLFNAINSCLIGAKQNWAENPE